jgi:hypothetical protein
MANFTYCSTRNMSIGSAPCGSPVRALVTSSCAWQKRAKARESARLRCGGKCGGSLARAAVRPLHDAACARTARFGAQSRSKRGKKHKIGRIITPRSCQVAPLGAEQPERPSCPRPCPGPHRGQEAAAIRNRGFERCREIRRQSWRPHRHGVGLDFIVVWFGYGGDSSRLSAQHPCPG